MVGPRGKRKGTSPFLLKAFIPPLINHGSCLVACQLISQYFFVLLKD
jgi:hypothetical protein